MTSSMRDGMKYCQFTEDSNLNIIREIGDGGYGTVHYAEHTTWGRLAIKSLKNNANHCNGYSQALQKEVNIHSNLRHGNVVQFLGFLNGPKIHGIVMEYLSNGSLDKFIDEGPPHVDRMWYPLKQQWAHDVASGMCFIHNIRPPIIHMDLKLSNVLLDHGYKAKITDFGISEYRRRTGSSVRPRSGARGTLQYTSPELFGDINSEPSPSMDVYAFAILLWELFTEKVAFSEVQDLHISLGVQQGQRPNIELLEKSSPSDIPDLVCRCWANDPITRPTFEDIHNYIRNDVDEDAFQLCLTRLRAEKSPSVNGGSLQTDGPSSVAENPPTPDFSLSENRSSGMIGTELAHDLHDLQLTSVPVQRRTHTNVNQTDYSLLPSSGFQDLHSAPTKSDTIDFLKQKSCIMLRTIGPETADGLAALEDPKKKAGQSYSPTEEPATLPPILQPDERKRKLLRQQDKEIEDHQRRMMASSVATDAEPYADFEKPSMHPSCPETSFASTASSACTDKSKCSELTRDSSGSIHLTRGDGKNKSEINITKGSGGNVMVGDHNTLVVYNRGNAGPGTGTSPRADVARRTPKPKKQITVQKKLAPEEAIKYLSKHVGNKWKNLARNLGFSNGELEAIHHDYRTDGLREVIYQMLFQWRLREGDAATLKVLGYALIGVKLGNLCEKLAEF